MTYKDKLQALLAASGVVETAINSNGGNPPTAAQAAFLTFLQTTFKAAVEWAIADPDVPEGV